MLVIAAYIATALAAASPFAAADDSPRSCDANSLLRLQDYLRCAAANNPSLKASFEQWRFAVNQVPQARALPDPQFTYRYYIEHMDMRSGPQEHTFELMQMFPWFGTIEARTDAASAAAAAAAKQYEAARLKLFYEVKDAFYEYSYLAQAVEISRQNLQLLQQFEQVARTMYTAALAAHPDIIRAQVELAELEDTLKSLEQLRQPICARLNAALNRPTDELLPWPQQPPATGPAEVPPQRVLAAVRANNPQLQVMQHQIEQAGSAERLAEKRSWPDVGIGVETTEDMVMAMFSLNLPIWTDSYRAGRSQARADLARTRHEKTETENQLAAQAQQALYDLQDTARKMRLYGDILIPKAHELLAASLTAYQAGTLDFLGLINAQQTLLAFELLYQRSAAGNLQSLAMLQMLTADELAP
jgi:outer membrane protein TolC